MVDHQYIVNVPPQGLSKQYRGQKSGWESPTVNCNMGELKFPSTPRPNNSSNSISLTCEMVGRHQSR